MSRVDRVVGSPDVERGNADEAGILVGCLGEIELRSRERVILDWHDGREEDGALRDGFAVSASSRLFQEQRARKARGSGLSPNQRKWSVLVDENFQEVERVLNALLISKIAVRKGLLVLGIVRFEIYQNQSDYLRTVCRQRLQRVLTICHGHGHGALYINPFKLVTELVSQSSCCSLVESSPLGSSSYPSEP